MKDPILKFTGNLLDNHLEFMAQRDGSIDVEIDDPNCGDSERGFGDTLNYTLNKGEAEKLFEWLKFYLNK